MARVTWHNDGMRRASLAFVVVVFAACPPPVATEGEGDSGEGEGESSEGEGESGEGEGEVVDIAVFDYVEVAGSQCANGTVAGLGVSEADAASTTLAVLFMGGGACWDSFSCFGVNAASHINDTYSAAVMQADLAPVGPSGVIDRAPGAPFADAHLAFLPYCTADLDVGHATRTYQADLLGLDIRTVHHEGRANVVAWAATLAERFPSTTRVVMLGLSAGGYGAILNHDVFVDAFPGAVVDVLADGSPFVPPLNGLYGTWQTQWEMTLPEGCATCSTDFGAVVDAQRARHPGDHFALISTLNDDVIRAFFGYGVGDMSAAVTSVQTQHYATDDARAFVVPGNQHVLLGGYRSVVAGNGVSLRDYFDGFVARDERWVSVTP